MRQGPASVPTDEEVREVGLSLQGYTVCARGLCLARVGAEYVMRDGVRRCVRVPVEKADPELLGTMWAEFCHPESAMGRASGADDTTWNGTVGPNHVAIVLQGFTASTRGLCLVRVTGNYVTRDGARHCIRFLVDTVDPVTLGSAWAVFSKAAGWMSPPSVERSGIADRSVDQWRDAGEKRRASS
jgi:hypothetical protein